jgi:tetratricopeptide (TPR) repeat protein/tRNA A-37 threonylcarbamoyl transferase component Bud32
MSEDRNLKFGLLAHQLALITEEELLSALHAWFLKKDLSLAEVLRERGSLDAAAIARVDALLDKSTCISTEILHPEGPAELFAATHPVPRKLEAVPAVPAVRPERTERFTVLRVHAVGGVGRISIAHDAQLQREVVLKEIQEEFLEDQENLNRFVVEAQITGRLEHPGVAPVYSLGAFPDGRPYYVMRFIRGRSLSHAIEHFHRMYGSSDSSQKIIEMRKLLRHFLDACNTIEYAHNRGVIHRDIKPDNIMLGRYGETIVVDWGLAKPLDETDRSLSPEPATIGAIRRCSLADTSETQAGVVIGTPEYMSPEQAEGVQPRVGPASDVYSLGATLYSILTGRAPIAGNDVGEVLRRVRTGNYPGARAVDSAIPVHLEAICRMAMALKPEDRYASPRRLADDVERWMADQPVAAYPESLRERGLRWARRHRAWANALAVTVLVLALTASGAAVQVQSALEKAQASNKAAAASYVQARQAVDTFLAEVGTDLREVPGVEQVYQGLMERAEHTYEAFAKEGQHSIDHMLRFQATMAVNRLGEIRAHLGHPHSALVDFEKAHSIFLSFHKQFPDREDYLLGLASSCLNSGKLYGNMSHDDEKRRERKACFENAVAHYQQLVTMRSNHLYEEGLSESLLGLGTTLRALRDPLAPSILRAARDHFLSLRKRNPQSIEARSGLARSCSAMAGYLEGNGNEADALRWYADGQAEMEALVQARPDQRRFRADLTLMLRSQARLQCTQAHFPEAERLIRRAVEIDGELVRKSPRVWRYQRGLGQSWLILSGLESLSDRPAGATVGLQAAISALTVAANEAATIPGIHQNLALAYTSLGELIAKQSFALAEANHKEAIARCQTGLKIAPDDDSLKDVLAMSYTNLASLKRKQGELSDAQELLDKAAQLLEDIAARPRLFVRRPWPGLACPPAYRTHMLRWQTAVDLHHEAQACQQLGQFLHAHEQDPEAYFTGARFLSGLLGQVGITPADSKLDRERAVGLLKRALALGLPHARRLRTEPDLAPLRAAVSFDVVFPKIRAVSRH